MNISLCVFCDLCGLIYHEGHKGFTKSTKIVQSECVAANNTIIAVARWYRRLE